MFCCVFRGHRPLVVSHLQIGHGCSNNSHHQCLMHLSGQGPAAHPKHILLVRFMWLACPLAGLALETNHRGPPQLVHRCQKRPQRRTVPREVSRTSACRLRRMLQRRSRWRTWRPKTPTRRSGPPCSPLPMRPARRPTPAAAPLGAGGCDAFVCRDGCAYVFI